MERVIKNDLIGFAGFDVNTWGFSARFLVSLLVDRLATTIVVQPAMTKQLARHPGSTTHGVGIQGYRCVQEAVRISLF